MHEEDPGAFSIFYKKDLMNKLGGMHQEIPGAFSIYL